ncbi:chromate transporter [Scopulibacillus daqui]|uniref:Chromate transporter n=1 Tax=Scopulibacillus daqui TaxID=1469162 RepID=A0ABS2Q0D6_9BACL|nr:chromate transporter [Scopulibacillus daqui]MBM7645591.1 chromate transporter [Scopulibacillus daqui]
MILLDLFIAFFKIGIFSFGGGYAMIPVIEHESVNHGWISAAAFADSVSVAGMSPGPVAMNAAIFVGYKVAGVAGAIAATLGMSLPSILIIVLLGTVFYKIKDHPVIASVFYGLRPVITAFILFAACRFAIQSHLVSSDIRKSVIGIVMLLIALVLLFYKKVHPLALILSFGVIGILGGWLMA